MEVPPSNPVYSPQSTNLHTFQELACICFLRQQRQTSHTQRKLFVR